MHGRLDESGCMYGVNSGMNSLYEMASTGEFMIEDYRRQIDRIDGSLFRILSKRFDVVKRIKQLRPEGGPGVYDAEREKELIESITTQNPGLSPVIIKDIYEAIFKHSKLSQLERKTPVVNIKEYLKKGPLLIAGPCAVESREQIETIARELGSLGVRFLRGGVYKPRTSPDSFQGLGIEGLVYLREAANKYGMHVVTEIMDAKDLEESYNLIDIIQIGTRNMASYGLLKQIGKMTAEDAKPVLLKRGMSSTIDEFIKAAAYITNAGNPNVILCLRGIRTFEQIDSYLRNTPDLGSILELKERTKLPVIFDPSHSTGRSEYVVQISKAAIALGADGLIIETHTSPENALIDGRQSITPQQLKTIIQENYRW
jgi:3-deoxy-7-phosphoheptulonate synthase / chorismate mutase